MVNKNVLIIGLIFCTVEYGVHSNPLILEPLKKGLQATRCKLHQFGSKIIQHEHYHGDPCQSENPVISHREEISSVTPHREEVLSVTPHREEISSVTTHTEDMSSLQPLKVTSEAYPTSLSIDVRLKGESATQKHTTSDEEVKSNKKEFLPVPDDGGRNVVKVGCNNGQVQTSDGCMEEI